MATHPSENEPNRADLHKDPSRVSGMFDQVAPAYDRTRLLYAGYFLYQLPATERLNLSFAGRYDGEAGGQNFVTGRFTAMYEIPEMEARLRGSLGGPLPRHCTCDVRGRAPARGCYRTGCQGPQRAGSPTMMSMTSDSPRGSRMKARSQVSTTRSSTM